MSVLFVTQGFRCLGCERRMGVPGYCPDCTAIDAELNARHAEQGRERERRAERLRLAVRHETEMRAAARDDLLRLRAFGFSVLVAAVMWFAVAGAGAVGWAMVRWVRGF